MKSTLLLVLIVLLASDSSAQKDHSEFIEGPFDLPQEVTDTCLGCHEEAVLGSGSIEYPRLVQVGYTDLFQP